jgi:hypothetical protein
MSKPVRILCRFPAIPVDNPFVSVNPLSHLLQRLMEERRLNVGELSRMSGVSGSTVYHISSPGYKSTPHRHVITQIGRSLHAIKPLTIDDIDDIERAANRSLADLRALITTALPDHASTQQAPHTPRPPGRPSRLADSASAVATAHSRLGILISRVGADLATRLIELADALASVPTTARPALAAHPEVAIDASELPTEDPPLRHITPPVQRRTTDGTPYVEQTVTEYVRDKPPSSALSSAPSIAPAKPRRKPA